MTVSVLINSHNYRTYLREAVQSVLDQTHQADQIVIVDDGSSDGSVEDLREHFGQVAGVEIISQRNGGQLAAIVTGFLRATGDLIFLLDADDRYQRDHIAKVMSVYQSRSDVDFVFTGLQEFGESTRRRLFHSRDHHFGMGIARSFNQVEWVGASTSTLSCRRGVFEILLPILRDLTPLWRLRADDCLVRGSAAIGARKYFLAITTVDYRIHRTNNHVSKTPTQASQWQHWFRTAGFINRVHAHVGIDARVLRWTHKEFSSIPEPSEEDFASYCSVLKNAPGLSWLMKAGMYWRMRQHFRATRQKRECAPEPAEISYRLAPSPHKN